MYCSRLFCRQVLQPRCNPMVPLKLELKNFLSYGEIQTIDFSKHNLVCLSGKNGHGKSAILDAITWAVWGQARKPCGSSKADDSLLKLGQTKMLVILEFSVNSQLFRVRREFVKSLHKSIANLEFYIYSPETSSFVALTEKTIRMTQKIIDDSIKLDFDTFLNSSFLKQGNSNEFSKKSPRERKNLLTKILGIDEYDKIQQKILDSNKTLNFEHKSLLDQETKNLTAINELPALNEKLNQLEQQLLNTNQSLLTKQDHKILLEEKKNQITTLIEKTKQLLEEKAKAEEANQQLVKKFKSIATCWKENHKNIVGFLDDPALAQKIDLAEKNYKDCEKLLMSKISISQKILDLRQSIATNEKKIIQEIETEILATTNFLQEKEIMLAKNLTQKNNLEKQIKLEQEALTATKNKISKHENILIEQKNNSISIIAALKNKDHLTQKLTIFKEWQSKLLAKLEYQNSLLEKTLSSCPTCLQTIATSQIKNFQKHSMATKQLLEHQINRFEKILPKLNLALLDQEKKLLDLSAQEQEFLKLSYQNAELTNKQAELEKSLTNNNANFGDLTKNDTLISDEISNLKATIKSKQLYLEMAVTTEPKIKAEKESLHQLEQELEKLKEVEAQFQTHKLKLEQLLAKNELVKNIAAKKQEQRLWLERLSEVKQLLQTEQLKIFQITEQLGNTDSLKKSYFDLKSEWENLIKNINLDLAEQKKLFQEIAAQQAQINLREKMKTENCLLADRVQKLQGEISDNLIIADAFGKNGIQALLLEDVLPEIEQATNQILNIISETHAQVFIEPLKDLKKGGVKETLDIIISDINGVRDYEMFSGGEAFRIDFALRIGICQVIGKRSGVALSTLIIDEGFGALDEEGITLMTSCIYKVKSLFEKIIVVSHLPSMKEVFPAHLLVTKESSGSKVSVEYRG